MNHHGRVAAGPPPPQENNVHDLHYLYPVGALPPVPRTSREARDYDYPDILPGILQNTGAIQRNWRQFNWLRNVVTINPGDNRIYQTAVALTIDEARSVDIRDPWPGSYLEHLFELVREQHPNFEMALDPPRVMRRGAYRFLWFRGEGDLIISVLRVVYRDLQNVIRRTPYPTHTPVRHTGETVRVLRYHYGYFDRRITLNTFVCVHCESTTNHDAFTICPYFYGGRYHRIPNRNLRGRRAYPRPPNMRGVEILP